ncbi:MAG TPA: hypothetical protein VG317_17355, partial [Pseudonocardiaceae bacterium]|nr:hypothetical protein [Pseudonocardiaceae bacterium]
MANRTTGRGRGGRADVIEVFSPRRVGPWHLLRPLFRGRVLLVVVGLVAVAVFWLNAGHHRVVAVTVAVVVVALFLASFHATWFLAGLLVRSRAELTTAVVVVLSDGWLRSLTTAVWADAVMLGVPGVLLLIPVTRRLILGRFWCVLDRHRLRACLRQTKVRTM